VIIKLIQSVLSSLGEKKKQNAHDCFQVKTKFQLTREYMFRDRAKAIKDVTRAQNRTFSSNFNTIPL